KGRSAPDTTAIVLNMALNMHTMIQVLFLVLCSGILQFSLVANHLRSFTLSDYKEKKAFMCQKGNNYSLVAIEKNWCQAMQHCRTHFTDLASINDTQQNEKLRNKSEGKSFWIGLQYDKFQWMDNSCSTFSYVEQSESECFVVNVDYKGQWNSVQCSNNEIAICYKGNVKIRLIEEPKTWEEALNYCTAKHSRFLWIEDQEDQYAVAQWLNYTYTGSNPLWIGLKQSSVFGFWIWSDRIVNYNNWENGQQPEMPLSNQCGVINAETHTWSDENCWSQLPFLCEEDIICKSKLGACIS
ncbi:hypothetical protein CHARACLAT_019090, partial [Characodon lateralis]|nr:hypothetical protein [Characodon lateralis]